MKYYLILFLFIFTLYYLQVNNKTILYSNGETENELQNNTMENNIIQNNILTINDTFSMRGSLVSIIPPNLTSTHYSKNDNNNTSNSINAVTNFNLPNNSTIQPNGSINLSDNLVSLLSGIIIQSINDGNPTLSNTSSPPISNLIQDNVNLISGSWRLDVNNGNITNFFSNFEMITPNGTNIHWYTLNNFKSNEKLFFGNDNSIDLIGKLGFIAKDSQTNETTNVFLSINNLQLIQLVFLDKNIAKYFNSYPLYGTIDTIDIKN